MQYRFSELKRLAWVSLVSDIPRYLRMFTKEWVPTFRCAFFFRYPFYKILLTQNESSHTPVGMCGKYPWSERGKRFYFQYCYNLRRRLETCLLSFCSLSTSGPLFQVLCSFLAFWISWQDHVLWFWSLRSEQNLSVHLALRKYLKFLSRTVIKCQEYSPGPWLWLPSWRSGWVVGELSFTACRRFIFFQKVIISRARGDKNTHCQWHRHNLSQRNDSSQPASKIHASI